MQKTTQTKRKKTVRVKQPAVKCQCNECEKMIMPAKTRAGVKYCSTACRQRQHVILKEAKLPIRSNNYDPKYSSMESVLAYANACDEAMIKYVAVQQLRNMPIVAPKDASIDTLIEMAIEREKKLRVQQHLMTPTWAGYARWLDVAVVETLNNWCNLYPELLVAKKAISEINKEHLLHYGSYGQLNTNLTKLQLMSSHGMAEKTENKNLTMFGMVKQIYEEADLLKI